MNIIITGASRGIGKELTLLFAQQKTNNIYIISRNAEKLNRLADQCKFDNSDSVIYPLPFDLQNINDIPKLISKIEQHTDHIDIVVNNAGFLINKNFEAILPEEINQLYKVNVLSPFELIRCLLPLLKKSANAHVVNISSMGGFQGSVKFRGLSAYASSKAAIAVLTECLAEEFKETQIKFNCLALGAVSTEMLAEAFPGYQAPTSPVEMAAFIIDFALNGHKMFNGKIIPVSKSTP